jgi:hypothetical protein
MSEETMALEIKQKSATLNFYNMIQLIGKACHKISTGRFCLEKLISGQERVQAGNEFVLSIVPAVYFILIPVTFVTICGTA